MITVYGLQGNVWTEQAMRLLDQGGHDYKLVEDFGYARDEEGRGINPYIEDGQVYIRVLPTLCLEEVIFNQAPLIAVQSWYSGIDVIEKFCSRYGEKESAAPEA